MTEYKTHTKGAKKNALQKGEAVAYCRKNVTAVKWQDKKDVSLLTAIHSMDFQETRKVDQKTGATVLKPTAVIN